MNIQPIKTVAALALLFLSAGAADAAENVLQAKRVKGELPLDPYSSTWKDAPGVEVSLSPQSVQTVQIFQAEVDRLTARAVHNGKEIAFLIEWTDNTRDAMVDMNSYSDAAALQFPAAEAPTEGIEAAAMMGDRKHPVNIWFWKMAWQEKQEPASSYYIPDAYLQERKGTPPNVFLGGVEAGNPVSPPHTTPVNNLMAGGARTLTALKASAVNGAGKWKENRWSVVFRRKLAGENRQEAAFVPGKAVPVAFTVWNGSEGHRGSRKVFSGWYEVNLDK